MNKLLNIFLAIFIVTIVSTACFDLGIDDDTTDDGITNYRQTFYTGDMDAPESAFVGLALFSGPDADCNSMSYAYFTSGYTDVDGNATLTIDNVEEGDYTICSFIDMDTIGNENGPDSSNDVCFRQNMTVDYTGTLTITNFYTGCSYKK